MPLTLSPYIRASNLRWAQSFAYICHFIVFLNLHVFRFAHDGRVCSGDYLKEGMSTVGYLEHRGKFLLGMVIALWIFAVGFVVTQLVLGYFESKE